VSICALLPIRPRRAVRKRIGLVPEGDPVDLRRRLRGKNIGFGHKTGRVRRATERRYRAATRLAACGRVPCCPATRFATFLGAEKGSLRLYGRATSSACISPRPSARTRAGSCCSTRGRTRGRLGCRIGKPALPVARSPPDRGPPPHVIAQRLADCAPGPIPDKPSINNNARVLVKGSLRPLDHQLVDDSQRGPKRNVRRLMRGCANLTFGPRISRV